MCVPFEPIGVTKDESLLQQVKGIRVVPTPIWEPNNLYGKFTNQKNKGGHVGFLSEEAVKPSWKTRLSMWLRANLFIPDAKSIWYFTSQTAIDAFLKEEKVDVIISTGPPQTTHLIARRISKKHGIPWVADFRDPWTNIDFFHKLPLTSLARFIHKKLEKSVLKEATKVVTVSWSWRDDFMKLYNREVEIITNGFDPADFDSEKKPSQKFTLTHSGSINPDRNHSVLWKALRGLLNENKAFEESFLLEIIGPVDASLKTSIVAFGMEKYVNFIPFLKHREAIEKLCQSEVLLLLINDAPNIDGIIPGKLYEYLAARRPILAIGNPNGDFNKILKETGTGSCNDFTDEKGLSAQILIYFEAFQKGELNAHLSNIEAFSRQNLAKKYCSLLDQIISGKS